MCHYVAHKGDIPILLRMSPLLFATLLVCAASSLSRTAAAQSSNCLDTVSYQINCIGGSCTADHCIQGSAGGYCNCGYGLCNSKCQYQSCNASGSCFCVGDGCAKNQSFPLDGPNFSKPAQELLVQTKKHPAMTANPHPDVDASLIRYLALSRVLYLPQVCGRSYVVVFPE